MEIYGSKWTIMLFPVLNLIINADVHLAYCGPFKCRVISFSPRTIHEIKRWRHKNHVFAFACSPLFFVIDRMWLQCQGGLSTKYKIWISADKGEIEKIAKNWSLGAKGEKLVSPTASLVLRLLSENSWFFGRVEPWNIFKLLSSSLSCFNCKSSIWRNETICWL